MCICDPCAPITAAALTIVQCLLHMGTCIWLALVYTCQRSMLNKSSYETIWYMTYFYRRTCNNKTLISHKYTFLHEVLEARSTYGYLTTYAIFDFIWIITAFGLLIGVFYNANNRFNKRLYFFPWIVWTIILCLMDLIIACIYASHISQTQSYNDWLYFIGAENKYSNDSDIITPYQATFLENFTTSVPDTYPHAVPKAEVDNTTTTTPKPITNTTPKPITDGPHTNVSDDDSSKFSDPSTLMSLFFSRFIFIWLLNVILVVILLLILFKNCHGESTTMGTHRRHHQTQRRPPQNATYSYDSRLNNDDNIVYNYSSTEEFEVQVKEEYQPGPSRHSKRIAARGFINQGPSRM